MHKLQALLAGKPMLQHTLQAMAQVLLDQRAVVARSYRTVLLFSVCEVYFDDPGPLWAFANGGCRAVGLAALNP